MFPKTKTKTKTKNNETPPEEEAEEGGSRESVFIMPSMQQQSDTRMVSLYGPIEEDRCAAIVGALYSLRESGRFEEPVDPEKPEGEMKTIFDPIEFLISTGGGLVVDMFSVYDAMRDISKECEIVTFGIGKVMSAGVLLLAAGSPGKRKVGKHCRLMLHPISAGNYGQLHELQINFKETNVLQNLYIKELCALSGGKLSEKKLKSIFSKKSDTYFSAEQAVEWGIADVIV
jgi:ATP-dependent Clp endopeptidase proteolytic subunit ClpP